MVRVSKSYVEPKVGKAFTVGDCRVWLNEEATVLARQVGNGDIVVATRETPAHTWGPSTRLIEEVVLHELSSA